MKVKDVMNSEVVTVREDMPVSQLVDLLQEQHVHGAPVVDGDGKLIGFVSQEDILLGSLGRMPFEHGEEAVRCVHHIMTSPAVQGHEESDLRDLALMMWRFRIRHVPIVRDDKVTGILAALDFARLVGEGQLDVASPTETDARQPLDGDRSGARPTEEAKPPQDVA